MQPPFPAPQQRGGPFGEGLGDLNAACREFWSNYYGTMLRLHTESGRSLQEPIQDRNLGTTDASHVAVFERFWRKQLAFALGVPETEVGPRRIEFRPHRGKNFDVCWPLQGEARILISIKSMQNAYRNLTNRIEEALGDSALLRLYNSKAVFGFFFFILNGRVASGQAAQGVSQRKTGVKGVPPFLDLIEEGGEFFDLSDVARYQKPASGRQSRGRQDTILIAEPSLLDLLSTAPSQQPTIHYDGIAFLPTRIKRIRTGETGPDAWEAAFSPVDERLSHQLFLSRLLETARLREFIE